MADAAAALAAQQPSDEAAEQAKADDEQTDGAFAASPLSPSAARSRLYSRQQIVGFSDVSARLFNGATVEHVAQRQTNR